MWDAYAPIILITWALLVFVLLAAGIYLITGIKNRSRYYKEQIGELKEQLAWYKEQLEEQKKQCKKELRKLTRIAASLKSIEEALEEGLIEVRHKADDGKVVVLRDGTLVCEKGHVVYPKPEVEEHGQRESGLAPS